MQAVIAFRSERQLRVKLGGRADYMKVCSRHQRGNPAKVSPVPGTYKSNIPTRSLLTSMSIRQACRALSRTLSDRLERPGQVAGAVGLLQPDGLLALRLPS
jgi:hypothetical protein